MDSDLQYILGESGVDLVHQAAIATHYGTLRKFSAVGDDRAAIRTACEHDFALPANSPANRAFNRFGVGNRKRVLGKRN